MENQLATQSSAITAPQGQNWPELMRFAEFVCKADLMPSHLKGKPADCLLIAMQAQRWRMDFFAVAQCTSIVRGKPMYEGKLVAAAINTCGALQGSLSHHFTGDKPPSFSVMILGRLKGEEETREWEVNWTEGFAHAQDKAQWQSSPKKRLLYFATREWARVHMPEVMLGVRADDETFPDGSNIEREKPTAQPISQLPVRAQVVDSTSEVVTGEIRPECWSDLLTNNSWRNVSVPNELNLKSPTVGVMIRDRAEMEQAWSMVKDDTNIRWAMDCSRWIGIERALAAMGMDATTFERECQDLGLLKSDQTVFHTSSDQLAQLAKATRNMQLAQQQQREREANREAPAAE